MAKKPKYYQRPDGLFETIKTINGRRVAFRARTCQEVDRKLLEYREEVSAGRSFPVVADEWERSHEAVVSEATRVAYRVIVKRLKAHFNGPVSRYRPLDVQRYVTCLELQGRAGNSVQMELGVIRMIFSHAVLARDIDVSPATEVKKSRGLPRKTRTALTAEQENVIRASWDAAHFGLFPYFLLYTGMRRGEALALSYADIDRKRGVILVNKKLNYADGNIPFLEDRTKSANGMREVPLLPPLARALPKNRVGLIFPGENGGFMRKSEIVKNWKQYCRETGLNLVQVTDSGKTVESFPITPHCLRHSFATMCYEAGLDPRQSAGIVGDTPAVLEKVYTHLREERKQSASEKLSAYLEAAH